MKTKTILSVLMISLLICSCKNKNTTNETDTKNQEVSIVENKPEAPMEDNSMVSVDWMGSYEGTLPCADCDGIKTTIVLNKDLTYTKTEEYVGEKDAVSKEDGTFEWDKTGSFITLSKDKRQYKVGENQIIHLDNDGKEITGKLAQMYVLKKQ